MSSVERFLRRERLYANRFLQILTLWPSRVLVGEEPDPAKFQAMWIKSIGPNWEEEMRAQVDDLAVLLDYLQERKVRVRVILPPQGTWHDGLPFDAAYRDMLRPILEPRKIPVTDLRRLLPDEDFGDAGHLRYSGQWKLHRVYREMALQALAEMGTELQPSHLRLASP